MDVLQWIVPCPKKAAIGSSHVELGHCLPQGDVPAALAPLLAERPAGGPDTTVEVRVDAAAGLPAEGYTLSAGQGLVVIVGADAAGAFYGAQTLLALAAAPCPEHARCVPECEVRDWPDLPLRGTIEGFYGTPWSHAARLDHLRFSARHKLNAYVYAPKDDPFHRERWREPYPEEELARLAELVAEAARQHVRFVFALSPGLSMVCSDPAERAALRAKAGQVWEAGVREFALLFDDIPPELRHEADREAYGTAEGASASAHAAVCRDFAAEFLARRGAERPLTMVPTDYAGTARSAYRDRLADELPPDVLVWWTGPDIVVGAIPAYDMTAAAASYGHRLALWDNFPVNDFDFSRVFLGPLVGRATDLAHVPLAGITANPMVEATASRLALTTVADYAWHLAAYDPARSHRAAVRLLPGAAELLPLVEACSSWPPGDDQSPALTALCASVLLGEGAARLRAELERLAGLPVDVPGPFAAELAPWVAAARDMGAAGLAALDLLAGGDPQAARQALERAEAHEKNVLRGVIPPFARAVLERANAQDAPQE
ncbi:beta-N-acetylglucosaminidase domain-containing protein [Actinomadura sp. ATCC 31491]|uniref:Beta-N-acetylglucosaminidase domain-containing protein n=1 Tax=Actinomadura luzonensis TaxID=2805427 RepID=A0ABT0FXW0_9ACTN|nr:beta-N-acetylglucosaminidase domain-containing protein [Actinomadura luzonensis]MCK2217178.1 beta-N-acetylglucosaminidase domain-containing protein [Actinomadura luzonensis]